MTQINLLGYGLAMLMGLTLGLVGAGGSILTVPILVYLFSIEPIVATGYSLLVVGSAALVGAIRYWRNKWVNIRAALMFAVPAMLTVLAARAFLVPAIPDPVVGIPKNILIMLLFAVLMIASAFFMLKRSGDVKAKKRDMTPLRAAQLVSGAVGIGLLTGTVGAGGGFLIVPTLIGLFGLPVKEAIGTSLTIIAINSLMGFKGDLMTGIPLDWRLLGAFLAVTLLGMWVGTSLAKKMDAVRLRKIFGVLVLLLGICVLVYEIYMLFRM